MTFCEDWDVEGLRDDVALVQLEQKALQAQRSEILSDMCRLMEMTWPSGT